jgi:hypothetical protein
MTNQSFGGPYVQVAAICMTPLLEQHGPLSALSVIRIQDRIQLAGITDQMQPQPLNALWLVVALRAGAMEGKCTLQVIPTSPSGKQLPGLSVPILFEGPERLAFVATPLGVIATEEGLYWFEITLEGTPVSKVPLRVMYQKLQMIPGMQIPPQSAD